MLTECRLCSKLYLISVAKDFDSETDLSLDFCCLIFEIKKTLRILLFLFLTVQK